jgi:DNA processing protein
LKDGARLVECVEDVIEELIPQMADRRRVLTSGAVQAIPGSVPASTADGVSDFHATGNLGIAARAQDSSVPEPESADVKAILQFLKGAAKLHIDSIIDQSGLTASTVLKLLLELELRGIVTQHPGKLFSLG